MLMPKPQRSSMGEAPCEEEDDGNGWELVIKTESGRGVWFPPRPREGDEFGGCAVGGGRGKLVLDDGLDVVNAYKYVLWFEIC